MEPLSQVRALIDMTEDDNSEFTSSMIEDILHNLGARIDTRYNVNITHLIWLDGKNEKALNKCLNSSSIHVVSPLWVVECQQANEKVEENAWPAEVNKPQANKTTPVKKPAADEADNKTGSKGKKSSIKKVKADSDDDSSCNRAVNKKRKASKPKSKTPTKKTIVLSDDADQDVDEEDSETVAKTPKTPKSKSLGTKRRPSSVKKAEKGEKQNTSNCKELESDTEDNQENQPPTNPDAAPKGKQEEASPDNSPIAKSRESPASAQKKKVKSICLSQVDDFVRDAAYDMAKNHQEYVIFETSDAQYVVVQKPVRTVKVFYALAKGSWVVSAEWVLASVTASKWLNPEAFEFKELPSERSRKAHSDPNFKGLFHGEHVFVRKGVEPGQSILQELFLICGAVIVPEEESASTVIAAQGEPGGISPKWLLDSLIVFEKLDAEGYLTAPISPSV